MIHECPQCGRWFTTASGLGLHRNRWSPACVETDIEYFTRHVIYTTLTGCWTWQGPTSQSGRAGNARYGVARRRGTVQSAHRWVYVYLAGPIPDGYELHHTCHVTLCVNPVHLVPVTPEEHAAIEAEHRREQWDAQPAAHLPVPW